MQKQSLSILIFILFISPNLQAEICSNISNTLSQEKRFLVKNDEVTDTKTGLIWKRCLLGLSGENCSQGSTKLYTLQEARQMINEQSHGFGQAWRLPNIQELNSILEYKCYSQNKIDVFPKTSYPYALSTTSYSDFANSAWYVDFSYGYSYYHSKLFATPIRLVRPIEQISSQFSYKTPLTSMEFQ